VGVVTRGWADPQNYQSLTRGGNYASKRRGEPLVPGRFDKLTFDLQPDDQHILPGEQLALMIFSSDANFTLHPNPGTELTIDLDDTSVSLPVVGGARALRRAGVANPGACWQRDYAADAVPGDARSTAGAKPERG
jgi:X-Pro dipeptidyl-peptidase